MNVSAADGPAYIPPPVYEIAKQAIEQYAETQRKLDLACTALRHYAKIDKTLGVDSVAGKALGEVVDDRYHNRRSSRNAFSGLQLQSTT